MTGRYALRVRGLNVGYGSGRARTRVLQDVWLNVRQGEIVGVIGETGSGKSTLARAISGLVPVESGSVQVAGTETAGLTGRALRQFRRSGALHHVFQDPLRSLDPDLTIGRSVAEGLAIAGEISPSEQRDRVRHVLRSVGLPETVLDRYPGQISGGQRQRASIARAIAGRPRLLILDEPVSALDASNRNHVLRLIDSLRLDPQRHHAPDQETDIGASPDPPVRPGQLLISHDLSSLAGIADRVVVLYRGRIVEEGPIHQVFEQPEHPYTALLIASAPSVRPDRAFIPAQLRRDVPAAGFADDAGCAFAPRCRFASSRCRDLPGLSALPTGGRSVACHAAGTWRAQLSDSPASSTPSSTI